MASPQVKVASNSTFDCILRDHNRRDRYSKESRAALQKNLKDLVRDRLQSCMSTPLIPDFDLNENSTPVMENAESRSRNEQSNNKSNHVRRKSRANERWNRAREMVLAVDNPDGLNQGGVSSLVKKWHDFETDSIKFISNTSNPSSPESIKNIDEKREDSTISCEALLESERTRISNIIKQLKIENVVDERIPRVRTTLSEQLENRGHCSSLCSPRIRGRQALSNLLMQMERDRHHELQGLGDRKPVSEFSHKGRIQALLRIKLLRRGSELRDNRLLSPTICKLNSVASRSTIMHLRERFSALVDHCATSQTKIKESESTSTSKRSREENNQIEVNPSKNDPELDANNTVDTLDLSTPKRLREENSRNELTCSTSNQDDKKSSSSGQQVERKFSDGSVEELEGQVASDREADDNWGPQSEHSYDYNEIHHDWINKVARPKSDWDILRKARYQEMLDSYTQNADISILLQRKSVSTFLSSGLKERIEQLMIARLQAPISRQKVNNKEESCHYEEQHEEEYYDDEDDVENYDDEDDYNEDDEDEEDEYDDEETPRSTYLWQSNKSENSDQFSSPSMRQSPSSISYSNSSRHRSSIEMELMYDLRGHMQQIHRELSQIRKSVHSCVTMQEKLQRSIKPEMLIPDNHSVGKEGKQTIRRLPTRGKCCICHVKRVDSLLYRCGHMCMCFRCAHDHQWNEGNCPVCTAPILDIVRPCVR